MVLQSLMFARFQGGQGPFLAVRVFKKNICQLNSILEERQLGWERLTLRGVWTASYSSGLECILPISNSSFLLELSTNAYL